MKESCIFYNSFFEAIKEIEDVNSRVKLYEATLAYALQGEDPKGLIGVEKAIFALIKPQINANNKRYEDGKKGADFGKLGGRPKKQKTPVGFLDKTPDTKEGFCAKTPNVNVNVNENVNENVNVNENENPNPNPNENAGSSAEKKEEGVDFSNSISYNCQSCGTPETKLLDPYEGQYVKLFERLYKKIVKKPFIADTQNRIKLANLLNIVLKEEGSQNFEKTLVYILKVLKNLEFEKEKPYLPWLLVDNNFVKVYSGQFDFVLKNDKKRNAFEVVKDD